jgi:hypothetical protein
MVNIQGSTTKVVIELSIFLAVEINHSQVVLITVTKCVPWLVSSSFGLVHSLGVASALSEAGLPQSDMPWAWFMSNISMKKEELLFVFLVVSLRKIQSWLPVNRPVGGWPSLPYASHWVASFR